MRDYQAWTKKLFALMPPDTHVEVRRALAAAKAQGAENPTEAVLCWIREFLATYGGKRRTPKGGERASPGEKPDDNAPPPASDGATREETGHE